MCAAKEVFHFKNYDLKSVVTPVDVDALRRLMEESSYDVEEAQFLLNGFTNGFSIGYEGPSDIQQTAPNLKLRTGDEIDLWNKVMKEVRLKRYAGPFKKIPYKNYIQSPIGLVPKDNGNDTRLIFHLSYPRNPKKGEYSVNGCTPEHLCKVKYPDFTEAVKLCMIHGEFCYIGRSDMRSAFRQMGILVKHFRFLLMKARNPDDGQIYWFVDKCLPFGGSISCSHFQRFSNCVAHIVQWKIGPPRSLLNYLDDYFFVALMKSCVIGK